MLDPIIGYSFFVDGTKRPIFVQLDGCQYVLDDDAERLYGIWLIPEPGDEIDVPIIISSD
jgi:hypothetical protein